MTEISQFETNEDESALVMSAAGLEPSAVNTPSLLDYHATYFLIAINFAVYLCMSLPGHGLPLLHHVSISATRPYVEPRQLLALVTGMLTEPFSQRQLISFGSCVPDPVLRSGQWWRLVSSIFVHVTLLHLLLNMWCLWNLGVFGERLLGKPGLIAVYVLTGAAGMLQSVLLSVVTGQREEIIAGASGAVFGLAGILIILLSNRQLAAPWKELRSLRRQVVFFALANLALGALPGLLPRLAPGLVRAMHVDPETLPNIDNSAHLGGLLCGVLLGVGLFPRMTSGRSTYRARQAIVFSSAALLLALVSYAAMNFERGR